MPLHMAAQSGSVDCIELLLQHGANIEATMSDNRTVLHIAAAYGGLPAVKRLLEKGVQGTATSDKGWLPLHDACSKGSVEVARLLLHKYPNTANCVTTEENGRSTPLHKAAQSGSVDCIELLLKYGADIEATASDGSTPLCIAADNGRLLAVEHMLAKGARATATSDNGWLPLHWASANNHSKCVRILCKFYPTKIDSNTAFNDAKRTALHLAVEINHCNAVAALLECGANANKQMSDGRTALHFAAANDCIDCIERLLTANADIAIRNNVGRTALHIAAEFNSCNALLLLRQWQDSKGTVDDQAQQFDYVNNQTRSGDNALAL
jgi:ankyrin